MTTITDPMIQLFQTGEEPSLPEYLTLEGLPDTRMLWRELAVGEKTRSGDYSYLTDRWYPAPQDQVLVADRPRVWRPMGRNAQRWYVGGSRRSAVKRDGDPYRAFASLEEALKRIHRPAVGVVISLANCKVLHAFDPPDRNESEIAK